MELILTVAIFAGTENSAFFDQKVNDTFFGNNRFLQYRWSLSTSNNSTCD